MCITIFLRLCLWLEQVGARLRSQIQAIQVRTSETKVHAITNSYVLDLLALSEVGEVSNGEEEELKRLEEW